MGQLIGYARVIQTTKTSGGTQALRHAGCQPRLDFPRYHLRRPHGSARVRRRGGGVAPRGYARLCFLDRLGPSMTHLVTLVIEDLLRTAGGLPRPVRWGC